MVIKPKREIKEIPRMKLKGESNISHSYFTGLESLSKSDRVCQKDLRKNLKIK
jgi:hypothetical protein